jgi:hypothetical protein
MIILVSKRFFRRRFLGATIWPFILIRESKLRLDPVFMNHERIHLRQQTEMLVLLFYLWYGVEFLIRLIQLGNKREAYRNISFEREAYKKRKRPGVFEPQTFFYVFKVYLNF